MRELCSCLSSLVLASHGLPTTWHKLCALRSFPKWYCHGNALVGEFMVAFLLVFTALRTAVNSDFVYSLMASSCRIGSLRKGRKCTFPRSVRVH